jgi:hypothetical protein
MRTPNWLEQLRQALTEQRLPSSFVEPFLDELLDHLEDLKEATMSIEAPPRDGLDAVMGDPRQLAAEAGGEFRRRTFLGRRPVVAALIFLLAPLPFVSLLALTLMLIGQLAVYVILQTMGEPALTRLGEYLDGKTWLALTLSVAQTATLWTACRLAWRQRLSMCWTLFSIPSLAALALAMLMEDGAPAGTYAMAAAALLPLLAWGLAAWRYARLPLADDVTAPRYPRAALLLRSVATTWLSMVAYMLSIATVLSIVQALPGMDFTGREDVAWPITMLLLGSRYVPFALAAWVCCLTLPAWAGKWWKGSLLACLVVALAASLFRATITTNPEQSPHHSFSIGMLWGHYPWMIAAQAAVPLAVWAACAWRHRGVEPTTPALA